MYRTNSLLTKCVAHTFVFVQPEHIIAWLKKLSCQRITFSKHGRYIPIFQVRK